MLKNPSTSKHLSINISKQLMSLCEGDNVIQSWSVSTALNGPGEEKDTGCTPRGQHIIRAMIGFRLEVNAVLVGRRPTGEIYDEALAKAYPNRDWILTRVLWLSGTEVGLNRLGNRDTFQRYIYIHGTPDTEPMGIPLSHGCIRMRNADIIALFEQCFYKMRVLIS